MKGALWIFGTGGHARKACQTARDAGWRIAGFVDEAADACSPLEGVAVTHADRLSPPGADEFMFVAIGRPEVRMRLMDRLAQEGWRLPVIEHRFAWIAPDARVAEGVLVAAGAVVETGSIVERGAIVDIGALVDHDCRIGAFCHVRPGQVILPATALPSPEI